MQIGAMLVEKLWSDGKRLKPREVVAEFEKTIRRRARPLARGSQLLAATPQLPPLAAPARARGALGLQRQRSDGDGAHGGHSDRPGRPAGRGRRRHLKRLSRAGVELFFTQVFRDGYFHADMHPGNIFVATDDANFGKYIALDFGIMGTLSERDKSYLAQNFLAFFRRDYHRVATAHIESGWVPAGHPRRRARGRDPRRARAGRSTGRCRRFRSAAC